VCPTAASSPDLADALASRLDDVAPEGLNVRAHEKRIGVYRGDLLLGGSAAPGILDSESDDQQVETAARSTISAVQDVFAEELKIPWPAGSGLMPAPDTCVRSGVLLAWFGPEKEPVLALISLELRR